LKAAEETFKQAREKANYNIKPKHASGIVSLSKAFQILVKSLLNGSVQTSIQYKMQFAKGNMSKSSPLLNFKMVTFS